MTNTQIISEIALQNRFFAQCKKIACCGLQDDLYQEFLMILFALDKLPEIYNKPFFDAYCDRLIYNVYTDKSMPFYRKYRYLETNNEFEPDNCELPQSFENRCIEDEISKLAYYERELFYAVELAGSARKLALKTNIPLYSILVTMKDLKEKIKNSAECLQCLEK
jgi:hypothetical protein